MLQQEHPAAAADARHRWSANPGDTYGDPKKLAFSQPSPDLLASPPVARSVRAGATASTKTAAKSITPTSSATVSCLIRCLPSGRAH